MDSSSFLFSKSCSMKQEQAMITVIRAMVIEDPKKKKKRQRLRQRLNQQLN